MTIPDQLTLGRALAVPVVVVLFAWDFPDHAYWATAVFVVAMATDQIDGWLARRWNQTSAFGSLLDPIARFARAIRRISIRRSGFSMKPDTSSSRPRDR